MDILNGFIDGTGNDSKEIALVVIILIVALGFGKNTGFNLFNNSNDRSSRHHHKNRTKACNSQGG